MEAQPLQHRLVQRRPFLPICLLLLLGEAAGHGYEVTDRLRAWGFDLAGPGPVYRELRILEEGGLVRSMWSAPQSGPVPRVYELTDEGRAALDQASADLADLGGLLVDFQRRYKNLPSSAPAAGAGPAVEPRPAASSARKRRPRRAAGG